MSVTRSVTKKSFEAAMVRGDDIDGNNNGNIKDEHNNDNKKNDNCNILNCHDGYFDRYGNTPNRVCGMHQESVITNTNLNKSNMFEDSPHSPRSTNVANISNDEDDTKEVLLDSNISMTQVSSARISTRNTSTNENRGKKRNLKNGQLAPNKKAKYTDSNSNKNKNDGLSIDDRKRRLFDKMEKLKMKQKTPKSKIVFSKCKYQAPCENHLPMKRQYNKSYNDGDAAPNPKRQRMIHFNKNETAPTHSITNENNEMNKFVEKVFETEQLTIEIASYLHFDQALNLTLINKQFFYFTLNVSFWLNNENNNIYMSYFSKEMKQLIARDICKEIKHLTMYFLQMQNWQAQKWTFKENNKDDSECNGAMEIDQRPEMNIALSEKERKKCKFNKIMSVSRLSQWKHGTKNGSKWIKCNVIDCVFGMVNKINDFVSKNELCHNELMDLLLLGRLYNIIPINNAFYNLVSGKSTDHFLADIICEFKPIKSVYSNKLFSYKNTLRYMWYEFETPVINSKCLMKMELTNTEYKGYPNLFSMASLKCNFNLLDAFMNSKEIGNNGKIFQSKCQYSHSFDGILALIGLFLNHDVFDEYKHKRWQFGPAVSVLQSVLQPQKLLDLKKDLNNVMIPLTKEEEKWFDLFGNLNVYHPRKRLSMLAKFCYCTGMTCGMGLYIWDELPDEYLPFRTLINQIYNDFSYFCKLWFLNMYDDYKDNIDKQQDLWHKVKMVLQYFLGIGYFHFEVEFLPAERRPLIVKIQAIDKEDENFIETRGNGELYDLRPQNLKQLCAFYKLLQEWQPDFDNEMNYFFQNSVCDIRFNDRVDPSKNDGQSFQFDQIDDFLEFFTQVWEIGMK